MPIEMPGKSRRDFLKSSAAAICAAGISRNAFSPSPLASAADSELPAPEGLSLQKGLVLSMLPSKLPIADRFKLARDTGFEVIQAPTTSDMNHADEIKAAADSSGVRVDSVMNMDVFNKMSYHDTRCNTYIPTVVLRARL